MSQHNSSLTNAAFLHLVQSWTGGLCVVLQTAISVILKGWRNYWCEIGFVYMLTVHVTRALYSAQRQTCGSGSCSGATVEFISAKSSLPMTLRERTRPTWSYWCSVWKHLTSSWSAVWFVYSCLVWRGSFSLVVSVPSRSKVTTQQFPWWCRSYVCLYSLSDPQWQTLLFTL